MDDKAIRNADPAPARLKKDPAWVKAAASVDKPLELQKPKAEKALMLVNFQTPSQRVLDQIAVAQDTNEEASPEQWLGWVREYWWIEDKQHYRRDHTQREDHCQVRNTMAARNLSTQRTL